MNTRILSASLFFVALLGLALPASAATRPPVLTPIAGTQTRPPYPPLSLRMGEQGTTQLKVYIGVDGNVTDEQLLRTSGYNRLDQAAMDWVQGKI
jgi:protein TonB